MNSRLLRIRNKLYQRLPTESDINAWGLVKLIKEHLEELDVFLDTEPDMEHINNMSALRLRTINKLLSRLEITQKHLNNFTGVAAENFVTWKLAEQKLEQKDKEIEKLKEEIRVFHNVAKYHLNSYE